MIENITWVVPYYKNEHMLAFQCGAWATYPPEIKKRLRMIVVDDGSPIPAEPILRKMKIGIPISLFRITEDIGWNCGGAKNLGMKHCETEWAFVADIDMVVPGATWAAILDANLDPCRHYILPRIFPDGREVRPHADSFVLTKDMFWSVGGFDEDFAFKMGGSHFPKALIAMSGERIILEGVPPVMYGGGLMGDSTSNATEEQIDAGRIRRDEIWRQKRAGELSMTPVNHLRFPWEKVL